MNKPACGGVVWCTMSEMSTGKHRTQNAKKEEKKERTYSDQSVLGLETSHCGDIVINQTEASGLATTENGVEAEDNDARLVGDLVHLSEQVLDFSSRDCSNALVQDFDDLSVLMKMSGRTQCNA